MAAINYANIVTLTLDAGSTYNATPVLASFASLQLQDGADGDDNGIVADGDPITLFLDPTSINATLLGVDADGVAVQETGGSGTIYYVSNDPIGAQVTLMDATLDFATAPGTITSYTYVNLHVVQDNGGGIYEVTAPGNAASLSPPPTITDDQDGTADGIVSPGQSVTAAAGPFLSGTQTVVAVTGSAEVIIQSGGTLYMFSDSSYTAGDTVNGNASNATLCFAEGTCIATPRGEVPVEQLRIGDLVRTATGLDVPIKWIGRQTLAKRFARERAQLVRISRGALGTYDDLLTTGDHGLIIDGYVINAGVLVNGTSVDWVPMAETPERQTVFHIETAAHEVIFANGAAAETFIDYESRRAFDNYDEYVALFGSERVIEECPMPRISSARLLPQALQERFIA